MNIFKTSSIAMILAIGSFCANASFDGSASLELQFNTATGLQLVINDGQMVFDNLIDGDSIDVTNQFSITGDTSRSIVCSIDGNSIDSSTPVALPMTDTNSNVISTITFSLAQDCSISANQVIDITSSVITNSTPATNYSLVVTMVAAYDTSSVVSSYS